MRVSASNTGLSLDQTGFQDTTPPQFDTPTFTPNPIDHATDTTAWMTVTASNDHSGVNIELQRPRFS